MNIYLISRPAIFQREVERFKRDEGVTDASLGLGRPSEAVVEIAGRLCYMSYDKGRPRADFIANLLKQAHYSVLEHANWTLLFTGISRSCSHELVRHRHFSFSQLSQRYVDQAGLNFIAPAAVATDPSLLAKWEAFMDEARVLYAELDAAMDHLPRKAHRTAARCVLPNSTETKIAVTGNARAWREFIEKRAVPAADPEIRELATCVLDILRTEAPSLFGDLEAK